MVHIGNNFLGDPTGSVATLRAFAVLDPPGGGFCALLIGTRPMGSRYLTISTMKNAHLAVSFFHGDPTGSRTPVTRMRTWRPNH